MPPVASNQNPERPRVRAELALLLFLTLFGTYAYFWQSRDWNAASRLMLTYSLVDRHQLRIDGLERQAGYGRMNAATRQFEMVDGDLAQSNGHYFTDKAPGQSFLGALVYSVPRFFGWLDAHPIGDESARAYWLPDYVITLGTSGVLTALIGVVIYAFSLRLGATHRSGVLLGLAYGLATPAFVYATLFYGHQASAFCTFTSLFLLYRARNEGRDSLGTMLLAGFLAGASVVVEYQTAVISAGLGLYVLFAIRHFRSVYRFVVGAVLSVSLLLIYNYKAFGDPLDLGYAHEVSRQFSAVHSAGNPLGIRFPSLDVARGILCAILWGTFRGIVFYAPLLVATPLGLIALIGRRYWGVVFVSLLAIVWMVTLNISYPLWEGGWCTGPRLIVPAIPFAMLLAGGFVAVERHRAVTIIAGLVALAGSILMLACVAVGGRFPPDAIDPESGKPRRVENPVGEIAVPHWRGEVAAVQAGESDPGSPGPDPLCPLCRLHPSSYLAGGHQFERNAGHWLMEHIMPAGLIPAEPSPWQALQMAPLAIYLIVMVSVLLVRSRAKKTGEAKGRGTG